MRKRRLDVGDKVKVVGVDGEVSKGTVIDWENYSHGRVLLIQLDNGKEVEVPEVKARLKRG